MSGAMRKMGVYLGLLEDTDGYDDDDDDELRRARSSRAEPRRRATSRAGAAVANLAERRRAASAEAGRRRPRSPPMSRITTLHPRTYNEARTDRRELPRRHAGDHEPLRDGRHRRQASRRLRRRPGLRGARHASSG